jgi:hypothetical protein
MRFFLFILANAMLFLRPSELLPDFGDVELYRYVIAVCLFVSFPAVAQQLFSRSAGMPPITACVLGLLPAVILSHVSNGNMEEAVEQGTEFLKVIIYFVLLLGLVTTITRLRQFLLWLALFSAVLTCIAVIRYHGDTASPPPVPEEKPQDEPAGSGPKKHKKIHGTSVAEEVRDPETGELVKVNRMCGTGIFNDPNDLALVLITAIPLCLYWLTDVRYRAFRPLWIGLILLFGYALMLTHSRGGFLALMAGLVVFLQVRFGGKKTLALGMLLLPVLFAVFAGRMTSISTSEGTGQTRIQLWSDGLMYFRDAPAFGIGMEAYHTVSAHVAHNSYIHCYAELGLLGGTLFVGAFYFAARGLYSQRPTLGSEPAVPGFPEPPETEPGPDAEVRRLHPYLMAMFVAYAIGIAFLSRSYIVPTYLLLGLAVVYLRLRPVTARPNWCRIPLAHLAGVSVCFLAVSYTFVRMFVNWK